MTPLFACEDAAFGYEGRIVVSGLNFQVRAGEYLCIVGENGSGKSTLLSGLLRLKAPISGSVVTGAGLAPGDIGYLPQQAAMRKDFPASAYEVVLSGRLGRRGLLPFYSRADRAAAEENLARLGVAELRGSCYRELSGGQQRRVLLARALCAGGRALLLDEPVAGLDPTATQDLYRLIREINRERGVAVIMVSHDVGAAVAHASHILHLKNGQLFFGTAAEYRASAAGAAYLGGEAVV